MSGRITSLVLLVVVTVLFVSANVSSEGKKTAILLVSTTAMGAVPPPIMDEVYKEKLIEKGFSYQFDAIGYEKVTAERLALYNVVIMLYPEVPPIDPRSAYYEEAFPILLDYCEKGGGLFIFGDEHYDVHKQLNKFLAQIGAEVIPEGVIDEEKLYQQPRYLREWFCSTNNIQPHPITKGVKGLWYPLGHNPRSSSPGTMTLKVDKNWQIVVRANINAYSFNPNSKAPDHKTYLSEPPMVAARKVGKGRVVLFPTRNVCYVHQPYHLFFEGICLDREDGFRFVTNVYDWLAEPSLKSGVFGGYVEPVIEKRELPAIDFSKIEVENYYDTIIKAGARPFKTKIKHVKNDRKTFMGLVGLRSTHSSRTEPPAGKHLEPVEWLCSKARQLGYDFVVFTEDYEDIGEERWSALVEDCKRNSDRTFLAIPGIEIRDLCGDSHITFALQKWPKDEKLESEKRIMGHAGFYLLTTAWAPKFQLNPAACYAPYQPFQSGIEVYSYLKGDRLIGEAFEKYLWYQSNNMNLAPIVSHRIYSSNNMELVSGPRVHVLVPC